MQWYAYVPARVNVKRNVPPAGVIVLESHSGGVASLVEVWGAWVEFNQTTVVPTLTVNVAGLKVNAAR